MIKCITCFTTYADLAEEVIKDIRQLFLQNQIRDDGQLKRNPRIFTPWSARNAKFNKHDKARIMKLIEDVAYLNNKNIWQFTNTDIRVISVKIRDQARHLDELEYNMSDFGWKLDKV